MSETITQTNEQTHFTGWENMPQDFDPTKAQGLKDAEALSSPQERDVSDLFRVNPMAEAHFRQRLKDESIDLLGGNTRKDSVHFEMLTDRLVNIPDEIKKYPDLVQNIYLNAFEQADHSTVTPLPVGDDGKVIIDVGQPYHGCSSNYQTLSSIANYGIVASEWFGVVESEREGVFCAFIDEVVDMDDPVVQSSSMLRTKDRKSLSGTGGLSLLLDRNNPVFQQLKSLDYFQYKKDLDSGTVDLAEKYPPEIRDLYDNCVSPCSPGMRQVKRTIGDKSQIYYYWSAIPGGIPPQLVNGVSVFRSNNGRFSNLRIDDEEVQSISQLFPNATIFDEDRNALYVPNPKTHKNS